MAADPSTIASASEVAASAGAESGDGMGLKDIVPSLIGLAGVAVGGILQWFLATATSREQRQNKLEDDEKIEARDRGLAALALAEHLEDFTLACIEVVLSADYVSWDSPYDWNEDSGSPVWTHEVQAWPPLVDWRLVGFDIAVKATNFRRQLHFDLEGVRASSDYLNTEDTHAASAEVAARRGQDAWALAARVRLENGLDAFVWPDQATGLDALTSYVDRLEQRRETQNQSAAALMGADQGEADKPSE